VGVDVGVAKLKKNQKEEGADVTLVDMECDK
jgi:hypothetical protein